MTKAFTAAVSSHCAKEPGVGSPVAATWMAGHVSVRLPQGVPVPPAAIPPYTPAPQSCHTPHHLTEGLGAVQPPPIQVCHQVQPRSPAALNELGCHGVVQLGLLWPLATAGVSGLALAGTMPQITSVNASGIAP